jgi:AcrR family transcriptional regulator
MTTARPLLPRDARRAQILRTAAATFAIEGYAATSVEDVARAAGITKLIVYRHFESKADLYRSILEETSARAPERGHNTAVETLLRVARDLPDGFRLLFVHAAREADFAQFATDFRVLQMGVADARIGTLMAAGPRRVWLTSMIVDGIVDAVLGWMDVGDPADDAGWVAWASDSIRAMITAAINSPTGGPVRRETPARR